MGKLLNALGYFGIKLDESLLPADWKEVLEEFTDERHQIVRRGSTKVIERDEAKACTGLVEAVGKAINRDAVEYYHQCPVMLVASLDLGCSVG